MARQAIGEALVALGRYEEATTTLSAAYTLATAKNLPAQRVEALHSLALAEAGRGQHQAAFANLQRAIDAERELVSSQTRRYVTAVEAGYRAKQREATIKQLARDKAAALEQVRRERRLLVAVIAGLVLLAALLGLLYQQRRLRFQRDIARLEQQRMASQMNPHFIFNGLNSIKSNLIDGNTNGAVALLGNYSRFMRRVLESSIDQEVSLAEEIESCRLYVGLENARFAGEIVFLVDVEPELDTQDIMVPPLVLQPFLENSIHHGLRAKNGLKELRLQVGARRDGRVRIIITDNGIGRSAALANKARRSVARRSVGIDITRRRLQYFKRRQGQQASFHIKDLTDTQGVAAGTEVELVFGGQKQA